MENNKLKITAVMERTFFKFVEGINLTPERVEMIKVLWKISDGFPEFETSKKEIAEMLFPTLKIPLDVKKQRVYERFKSLSKWQERKGLEIIKVIDIGHGTKRENGLLDWSPLIIEVVTLTELVNFNGLNPKRSMQENLKYVVKKLEGQLKAI